MSTADNDNRLSDRLSRSANFIDNWLFRVFLVLLVLKASEEVTWSWWWITLPLWLFPAIVVLLFVFGLFFTIGGVLKRK